MEDLSQLIKNLEKRVIATELKLKTIKTEIIKEISLKSDNEPPRGSILAHKSKSPERKRMSVMTSEGLSNVLASPVISEKDLLVMKANMESQIESKLKALEGRMNSSTAAYLDSCSEDLRTKCFRYTDESAENIKRTIAGRLEEFERRVAENRELDLKALSLKAQSSDVVRANEDLRRLLELNHNSAAKNIARTAESLFFCEEALTLKISRAECEAKSEDISFQISTLQETLQNLENECGRRLAPLEKQLRGELEYEDAILEMKKRFLDMGKELEENYKSMFQKVKEVKAALYYKANSSDLLQLAEGKASNDYVILCEDGIERLQRISAQTVLLLQNFIKTSIKSNETVSSAAKNTNRLAILSQLHSLLQHIQKVFGNLAKGPPDSSGKRARSNLSFDASRKNLSADEDSSDGVILTAKPQTPPKGSARDQRKHSLSANQSSNTELINLTVSTKIRSRSPELAPFIVKNATLAKPVNLVHKDKAVESGANDSFPKLLANLESDSNISSNREMIHLISLKGSNVKTKPGGGFKGKKPIEPRLRGLISRAFPIEKTLSANNSFV